MNKVTSLTINQVIDVLLVDFPEMNKCYILFETNKVTETKFAQKRCEIIGIKIRNNDDQIEILDYERIIQLLGGKASVMFKETKSRIIQKKYKYQYLVVLANEKQVFTDKETKKEIMYYNSQIADGTSVKLTKTLIDKKANYEKRYNSKFNIEDNSDDNDIDN